MFGFTQLPPTRIPPKIIDYCTNSPLGMQFCGLFTTMVNSENFNETEKLIMQLALHKFYNATHDQHVAILNAENARLRAELQKLREDKECPANTTVSIEATSDPYAFFTSKSCNQQLFTIPEVNEDDSSNKLSCS